MNSESIRNHNYNCQLSDIAHGCSWPSTSFSVNSFNPATQHENIPNFHSRYPSGLGLTLSHQPNSMNISLASMPPLGQGYHLGSVSFPPVAVLNVPTSDPPPHQHQSIPQCNNRVDSQLQGVHQSFETSPANLLLSETLNLGGNLSHHSRQTRPTARRSSRCQCIHCRQLPRDDSDTAPKKQHACSIVGCGKHYGKTSHLKAHLLWHAGEKPHKCKWANCTKAFTRSDELQRHVRTHTGERRYGCETCGKRFMRSDHLSKHSDIHKRDKAENSAKRSQTSRTVIQDDTLSQSVQFERNISLT